MLKDVDPDMSGKISFEEFVRLLSKSRGECSWALLQVMRMAVLCCTQAVRASSLRLQAPRLKKLIRR
jgi:hypothetical protein